MSDLISKKALINALFVRDGKMCPDTNIDNFPITVNVKYVKETIRKAPIIDAEKMFVCNCKGCKHDNTNECMHCMRAYTDCYEAEKEE